MAPRSQAGETRDREQALSPHLKRTIEIGDTTYDIFSKICDECGINCSYTIIRTSGAALSVYRISKDDYDDIDQYIAKLHESFLPDAVARLERLRKLIHDCNSQGFFEAEDLDVFRVRLLDRARLLLSKFAKNGGLDRILDHSENEDDDLVSAFLFGMLTTEVFWIDTHEEAIFEGYAHIEGRETGRPLAIAARRRQGRQTRKAVIRAAREVFQNDHALRRNDAKAAAAIAGMKLPELKKRDGTFLGEEAIVKHLRAARCEGAFGKS